MKTLACFVIFLAALPVILAGALFWGLVDAFMLGRDVAHEALTYLGRDPLI